MAVDISNEVVQNPEMLCNTLKKMATLINELRTDHATFRTSVAAMETLIEELHDDHATFRTHCVEMEAWAEALATKLNSDVGVTDADYDATITASPPATLTAAKPASPPAAISAAAINVSK